MPTTQAQPLDEPLVALNQPRDPVVFVLSTWITLRRVWGFSDV
jgi:hypothetical protein